jgi:hypothetical protein
MVPYRDTYRCRWWSTSNRKKLILPTANNIKMTYLTTSYHKLGRYYRWIVPYLLPIVSCKFGRAPLARFARAAHAKVWYYGWEKNYARKSGTIPPRYCNPRTRRYDMVEKKIMPEKMVPYHYDTYRQAT